MYNLYTPIKELNMKIEITTPPLKEMEDKGVCPGLFGKKKCRDLMRFMMKLSSAFYLRAK